mmetsp:Transcript_23060/g.38468  ORF Transcript_23060/g.38468 Transcript_23060/m.38468 type:complete len:291 (-) Transcript_23060:312-1184(-)
MSAVLAFIHKSLVSGALSKGWGGPVCRAALDFNTHIAESLFWLCVATISFHYYEVKSKYRLLCKSIEVGLAQSTQSSNMRTVDVCLSFLHFGMFIQIIYYKVNILSLINMIQPCHVILLLQGIALYSKGVLGVLITLFMLPAMTGTLLAMAFPDTGGLDQPFEMESYWLQHYLIQAMPVYLLVRRNYLALNNTGMFTIFMGLWILMVLHFSLYEVVDLSLDVNVEFMLCPTAAMVSISALLPSWVTWPSWRSTLTIIVLLVGTLISYLYIFVTRLIEYILPKLQSIKKKL